jgi:hypothetical protein
MTKHIEVPVKITGEILEFNASNLAEILETWRVASEYIKAYEKVKDRLKLVIEPFLNDRGQAEINGFLFRESIIQRMTYDKSVLRDAFDDQDLLDMFLDVSKTKVDNYLKENLAELGELSTVLRKSMIPVGRPYKTLRVEKLE